MKQIAKYLRLLPAVIAVAAVLLGVKVAGLVRDARAGDTSQAATTVAAALPQTASAPADASDAEASSSEVDVLTSLSHRRVELDAREKQLRMEQELIAAAEKRVDDKIASLKGLQSQIQALLVQRDSAQKKHVDSLVKTYASMKPRDAARIFDSLSDEVLVAVAAQMKPDVLGAILGQMQPEAARSLTVKLANRLKPADPAPVQVASVVPPAPATVPPASGSSTTTPAPATQAAVPAASPTDAAAKPVEASAAASTATASGK